MEKCKKKSLYALISYFFSYFYARSSERKGTASILSRF